MSNATAEDRAVTKGKGGVFAADSYTIRKKLLSFLGQKFHIYDPQWQLVGYVKQKAFKLKEDIRVYADETCASELLVIKARQIVGQLW